MTDRLEELRVRKPLKDFFRCLSRSELLAPAKLEAEGYRTRP